MTNYFMMGADGREYGPASGDDLCQWIRERRANVDTKVRREGEVGWTRMEEMPEFQESLAAKVEPIEAEPAAEPPPPWSPFRASDTPSGQGDRLASDILARDYELNIGDCFSRGWEVLIDQFWLLVGATALVYLLVFGVGSVPVFGVAVALAFLFVLLGGLNLLFLKRMRGEPGDISVVFSVFTGPAFVPLLLAGIIASALSSVGLLLCVVPGVYLIVAWYLFAPLLIIDKGLDFWQALECSRQVVTRHWWACFGLMLLGILAAFAGVLACFVGVVVTLPLATAAIVVAYDQIFGPEPDKTATDVARLPASPSPSPEADAEAEESLVASLDEIQPATGVDETPQQKVALNLKPAQVKGAKADVAEVKPAVEPPEKKKPVSPPASAKTTARTKRVAASATKKPRGRRAAKKVAAKPTTSKAQARAVSAVKPKVTPKPAPERKSAAVVPVAAPRRKTKVAVKAKTKAKTTRKPRTQSKRPGADDK